MTRVNQAVAVILALAGGAVLCLAVQWRFLTALGPGPGFFGVVLSVVMIALALSILVTETLQRQALPLPADFWPARIGMLRIAGVVAGLIWMALAFEPLGYRLAAFVFLLGLTVLMGSRNALVVLAVSLAGSVGVYALFTQLLAVRLPVGMFGF